MKSKWTAEPGETVEGLPKGDEAPPAGQINPLPQKRSLPRRTREYWYKCPNCSYGFPFTPHDGSGAVVGHCGHQCLNPDCGTMMEWDEPHENAGVRPCSHHDLKSPASVVPIKGERL